MRSAPSGGSLSAAPSLKFIADHRGRIANTAGDSVVAEFGSAADAVECAVEAQTALREVNSGFPPDRRIDFRMGIHRRRHGARRGFVRRRCQRCRRAAVHCEARRRLYLGSHIRSGAEDFAIGVYGPWCPAGQEHSRASQVAALGETEEVTHPHLIETTSPPPNIPSIAVLPLQNMSGDPDQEYFADGMVEEIITALSPASNRCS
jgi:adenylate cyclase